ncbi:MAG: TIGR02147 family protein, partial [Fibrobacter sp.]|nr:TIGR02147 family protein [Fibrobacter sp.]
MNSILMYQDYRRFLRDYYDLKKRTSAFSWRDYSRMSGFVSPVFMQRVCEGKANLGKKATVKVADAFKFVGMERDYFFNMVTYAQAKTDERKRYAYAEMQSIADANKVSLIGAEAYKYYDSWVHPVVR